MFIKYFFDHNDNFQWASVAALIAGIGALSSLLFSFLGFLNTKKTLEQQKIMDQKKIDADIISKSRMHWVDNTKLIISRFIGNSLDLSANNVMFNQKIYQYRKKVEESSYDKKIIDDKSKTKKDREEAKKRFEYWIEVGSDKFDEDMLKRVDVINKLTKIIFQDFLLIKLNFSHNKENKEVVDLCFEINEELRKFSLSNGWNQFASEEELIKAIKRANDIRNSNGLKIDKLTELLRIYYKREWEKVKKGE